MTELDYLVVIAMHDFFADLGDRSSVIDGIVKKDFKPELLFLDQSIEQNWQLSLNILILSGGPEVLVALLRGYGGNHGN